MIEGDTSDLRVGVYLNGSRHFEQLCLNYINVQIVQIDDENYISFYKKLASSDQKYELLIKDLDILRVQDLGYLIYLAIPIHITEPIPIEIFHEIPKPISLVIPSHIAPVNLVKVLTYKFEDNRTHYKIDQVYTMGPIFSFPKPIFIEQIALVDEFVKIYFDTYKDKQYLQLAIAFYYGSYLHEDLVMSFVNLCISLEALLIGHQKITHRISKCCAVINANSESEGNIIYKNMKVIYNHRSNIVHGDGFENENIQIHHSYLQNLVARTIIKLFFSTIKDKTELDNTLRTTPYGNNPLFNENKTFLYSEIKHQPINIPIKKYTKKTRSMFEIPFKVITPKQNK